MTHLKLSRLTHTSIFNGEAATLLHSYMIRSGICIRLAWTNATFGKQCKTVFSSSDLIMRISWRHPCLQLKGLQWEIKGSRLFCSVLLRHLALDTRNLWCTQTQLLQQSLSVFSLRYNSEPKWNWISTSREASQQQWYTDHNYNTLHTSGSWTGSSRPLGIFYYP